MDLNEMVTRLGDSRNTLVNIEPGKTIIGFGKQPVMVTPEDMASLNPALDPLTKDQSEWVWATGNRYVNRKDPAAQKYTGTNDYVYMNAVIWVDEHNNKFWGVAELPEFYKRQDGAAATILYSRRSSMRTIHHFPFVPKTFEVPVLITADGVAIIKDEDRLREADDYYRFKPKEV